MEERARGRGVERDSAAPRHGTNSGAGLVFTNPMSAFSSASSVGWPCWPVAEASDKRTNERTIQRTKGGAHAGGARWRRRQLVIRISAVWALCGGAEPVGEAEAWRGDSARVPLASALETPTTTRDGRPQLAARYLGLGVRPRASLLAASDVTLLAHSRSTRLADMDTPTHARPGITRCCTRDTRHSPHSTLTS